MIGIAPVANRREPRYGRVTTTTSETIVEEIGDQVTLARHDGNLLSVGTKQVRQKETVKQLLYGASEKVGKNSRFNKIAVLSRRRAFIQSAAVVLTLVGLAYVFGLLPPLECPRRTMIRGYGWLPGSLLLGW